MTWGGGVMRRSVIVGVVLCVCAVVAPAGANVASARGVAHAGPVAGPTHSSVPAASLEAAASVKAAFVKAARARARTSGATAPVPVTGDAATLSADPSTGLADGQQITVSGTGFGAKTEFLIVECPAGDTNALDCDPGTGAAVKTDATGSFSTPFTAVRTIEGFDTGTTIDCATADACDLTALDENLTAVAETPIAFDDVAIVPPTVSAVPSTGLLNDQKITVSGTNFTPNAPVSLSECAGTTGEESCGLVSIGGSGSGGGTGGHKVAGKGGGGGEGGFGETVADASGSFSTSLEVIRMVDGIEGPVDCAQPPGCQIIASNGAGTIQASVAISFADVVIVPPVMTATPSTGLEDGQTITVTGRGFSSRDELVVSECAAGSTDGSECVAEDGLGNAVEVEANRHGRFTITFNVARIITLLDGTVDCSQAPGCVIGAIDLESETEDVTSMVPIAFDPNGKPLPPLNLEVHVDPTATIGPATRTKGNSIAVEGSISCDRSSPTPVEFQLQVTEPIGANQAGGAVEGVASCRNSGAKFTVTVSSGRKAKIVFVPGSAGVLLTAFADSGSSAEQTTTNASITVKAPKT